MMFEILSFCMEFMKLYFVAYVFKQNFFTVLAVQYCLLISFTSLYNIKTNLV